MPRPIKWSADNVRQNDKRYLQKIFVQFVLILHDSRVYKNKKLRDPDSGKIISGYSYDTDGGSPYLIWVNPHQNKKDTALLILIHELMHIAFPDLRENATYTAEDILMKHFSKNQKRFLAKYIPKHYTKTQPDPFSDNSW